MTERSHPLLRLLEHLREYRWQVWLASFCSIMNKFWDLAPPILIGMAIDVVTYKEDSMLADFGYPDPYQQFLILVALASHFVALEVSDHQLMLASPLILFAFHQLYTL